MMKMALPHPVFKAWSRWASSKDFRGLLSSPGRNFCPVIKGLRGKLSGF